MKLHNKVNKQLASFEKLVFFLGKNRLSEVRGVEVGHHSPATLLFVSPPAVKFGDIPDTCGNNCSYNLTKHGINLFHALLYRPVLISYTGACDILSSEWITLNMESKEGRKIRTDICCHGCILLIVSKHNAGHPEVVNPSHPLPFDLGFMDLERQRLTGF